MASRINKLMGHLAPSAQPSLQQFPTSGEKPLEVVVSGGAGNIAYAIVFMIGFGEMAGSRKINLRLLDIPQMADALKGVEMELLDCAFPYLSSITCTTDYAVAFKNVDVALLIGARPRGPGMQRADLLKANGVIFEGQGKALDKYASRNVKVLVVGNPANTNALIAMTNAPSIPRKNFTAMTRLDQNRSEGQLALKYNWDITQINKVAVWGNHSKTMYADVTHGNYAGKSLPSLVDGAWIKGDFVGTIAERGAAIIKARGKSSAASAAKAAVDHVRDWLLGTPAGKWSSMAVCSDNNSYGVPNDLIFSFPCVCKNGEWKIVDGLSHGEYSKAQIATTTTELVEEKGMALAK